MATNEGSTVVASEGSRVVAREPRRGRWWFVVLMAAVAFPVDVVGGLAIGYAGTAFGGDTSLATNTLWGAIATTLLVSSVAVYYDRQYVASVSEWTPTRLYYLTCLGYAGMLIALLYVWRRHQVLGVP